MRSCRPSRRRLCRPIGGCRKGMHRRRQPTHQGLRLGNLVGCFRRIYRRHRHNHHRLAQGCCRRNRLHRNPPTGMDLQGRHRPDRRNRHRRSLNIRG